MNILSTYRNRAIQSMAGSSRRHQIMDLPSQTEDAALDYQREQKEDCRARATVRG